MKSLLLLLNFAATLFSALMTMMIFVDIADPKVEHIQNLEPLGYMLGLIAIISFINICFVQHQRQKEYEDERVSHRVVLRPSLNSDD